MTSENVDLDPVEELIEAADRQWAEHNHGALCFCSGWPEACVTGYTLNSWATDATRIGLVGVLRRLADMLRTEAGYPAWQAPDLDELADAIEAHRG